MASVLSIKVPGLEQMYCGYASRGASILVATIIIYNLNSIFFPAFGGVNPGPAIIWQYWLPRILQDVAALYAVIFWIWEFVDAYNLAKSGRLNNQVMNQVSVARAGFAQTGLATTQRHLTNPEDWLYDAR